MPTLSYFLVICFMTLLALNLILKLVDYPYYRRNYIKAREEYKALLTKAQPFLDSLAHQIDEAERLKKEINELRNSLNN